MKTIVAFASILSLGMCLAAPVLYFSGVITRANSRLFLLLASLAWFFLASTWASARKKGK